ncbi:MAG: NAD(P)-dependent oxidoreductase [Sphingomonadaceae bacterium]
MKIAVIGASGMTGEAIVEELSDRKHQVTGIGRLPAKIAKRDGVTAVGGDIMQPAQMASVLKGHDAVICAYAAGHTFELDVYKIRWKQHGVSSVRSGQQASPISFFSVG